MISIRKLFSIALMSAFIILVLISITSATPFAYITNEGSNNVSVIDTATDKVTATVNIGGYGVAATTYGKKVHVTDWVDTVSVIDTDTNKVTANISVGGLAYPYGLVAGPTERICLMRTMMELHL